MDRSPAAEPPGHVVAFRLDAEESWRFALQRAPEDLAFGPTGELFVLDGTSIIRLDAAGRPQATIDVEPRFGRDIDMNELTIDDDGHLILAGGVEPEDERGYAAWAAKLSVDGGVRWEWTIDHPGESSSAVVATDRDGAVFVAARIDVGLFSGDLDADIWVGRISP
jgi:hypothetical protein